MYLPQEQRELLHAIRNGKTGVVRTLLEDRGVRPDLPGIHDTTPLHEAVMAGSLSMVKMLVAAGADMNRLALDGTTALDVALDLKKTSIANYLRNAGASTAQELGHSKGTRPKITPKRKPRVSDPFNDMAKKPALPGGKDVPVFRADTLAEIFDAGKWVGKTQQMKKLWEQVPDRLKPQFDFAASLAEAQRQTLKQKAASKKPLLPPQDKTI